MAPVEPDYADDWLEAPERLLSKAVRDPQAVEQEFRALDASLGHRLHSVMHLDALVLAVIEPSARTVLAVSGPDAVEPGALDWELAESALRRGGARFGGGGQAGDSPVWAYVPGREAKAWDLPAPLLAALGREDGRAVLAVTTSLGPSSPLQRACDAYGLSGLESRVVSAVLKAGAIKEAARAAGVSYATAREAMSGALAKVGAPRLPGLVQRLSLLAFGVFPNQGEAADFLGARWGLTPRQGQIALLLAEGLTRAQAARALGLSEATVKKQADIVFQALGVGRAAEAARAICSAIVMGALSEASQGRIAWMDTAVEPLRLIRRPGGGRIAISDYGPRGGRPVLLVHACFSGRHPPRGLVAALVAAGWRPIAVDRPGYGLTDFAGARGLEPGGEPFGAAAHDMAVALDVLGLERADVIGRGGAQAALAFGQLYPERCGRVVLIAPIPPTRCDVGWRGLFGAYREIYRRRPELIPHSIRLMARLMDRGFVARMVRKTLAATPPDLAIVDRPGFDDDYYRTMHMYALGRLDGYIHEQAYVASAESDGYAPDSRDWTVLFGEHDGVLDPVAARRYWEARLPRARFETLAGHGRLLDYAVPDLVVDRLRGGGEAPADLRNGRACA